MSARPAAKWTIKTLRDRCHIEGEDDCWVWLHGTTSKRGAPQACIEGKNGTLVARWLAQHLGRDIAGKAVVPLCDNWRCLNPQHLRAISKSEVLRRAYAHGLRSGDAEYLARRQLAQRTGMAKLSGIEQAREIRAQIEAGVTIIELSARTGLWPSTLRDIKHHRSWKETHAAASVFTWRPQ